MNSAADTESSNQSKGQLDGRLCVPRKHAAENRKILLTVYLCSDPCLYHWSYRIKTIAKGITNIITVCEFLR